MQVSIQSIIHAALHLGCNRVASYLLVVIHEYERYMKNYHKYRESRLNYYKQRRISDPEWRARQNARTKQIRLSNPAKSKLLVDDWMRRNRDRMRNWHRNYRKYRMDSDPQWKLRDKFRHLIRRAITGKVKDVSNAEQLLGCTLYELRAQMESRFHNGMTWDLVLSGAIHLDHIRAVSLFDLTNPEDIARCFHWTNLQPLWRYDNQSKGKKLYIKTPDEPVKATN